MRLKPPFRVERIPAPGFRIVSADGIPAAYVYIGRKGLPDPQLTEAEARAVADTLAAALAIKAKDKRN